MEEPKLVVLISSKFIEYKIELTLDISCAKFSSKIERYQGAEPIRDTHTLIRISLEHSPAKDSQVQIVIVKISKTKFECGIIKICPLSVKTKDS